MPDGRIVYSYDMHHDETRISVSREHGTGGLLDALGAELQREPASA